MSGILGFQRDGTVYINDGAGNVVHFQDAVEFEKYTGETKVPTVDVSYEPARKLHTEFDGINTSEHLGQNDYYDLLIKNAGKYKKRIADPYYKLSVQKAKELKKAEVYNFRKDQNTNSFEFPEGSGRFFKPSNAVWNTVVRCMQMNRDSLIPCNEGKWYNHDNTESYEFTIQEFIELYNVMYDIPEMNFKNMMFHWNEIEKLKTVTKIKNYNFSKGWI